MRRDEPAIGLWVASDSDDAWPGGPYFDSRDECLQHAQVEFDAPVEVKATDDHAGDLVRITTEINRRMERFIRRAPEQWLWSHRRWKTSPPAASGPAAVPRT